MSFVFFLSTLLFKKNKQKSNGIVKAITQCIAVNETKMLWYVNVGVICECLDFYG